MSQPLRAAMFDFSQDYQKRSTDLSGPWPYVHPPSRERIKAALAEGCDCKLLITPTATLRRRATHGSLSIWLQCDGCGGSLGSALRRDEHPRADQYPPWDEELPRRYEAALKAYYDERKAVVPSPEQRREHRIRDYLEKSRQYEAWLRASPEWHRLVKRVNQRARGWCEACMEQSAELVVHHLTYAHGKLPPAWELRAVCRACHDRLHTPGDDWCDPGMGR